MTDEERRARRLASQKAYRQRNKAQCAAYAKRYRSTVIPTETQQQHRRQCMREYLMSYYAAHKDDLLKKYAAKRAANIDEVRDRARHNAKRAYAANPERYQARIRKYMSTEKGREVFAKRYERNKPACRVRLRAWKKLHPDRVNADRMKRAAAKLMAVPPWTDLNTINAFYKRAQELTKETGIAHDVDHIIPLQSRFVCGLHVAHNLQVIPRADNIRKGNRLPTMPYAAGSYSPAAADLRKSAAPNRAFTSSNDVD